VKSLVRMAGDEGRPGHHVRAGHFVEQVARVLGESAPESQVREGGGEDCGGR
jgi:hypothetical protein